MSQYKNRTLYSKHPSGSICLIELSKKKYIFFILCSIARILFLPCLLPCFIKLIYSVVQGMQVAAMPTDPECTTGKLNQVSKITKLEEENPHSRTTDPLARFKEQIKGEGDVYKLYQEIPKEE